MAVDPDLARGVLINALLEKIQEDPYPSSTMMDLVEELLTEEEIPAYVMLLQDKIRQDRFPSVSMMNRLKDLIA